MTGGHSRRLAAAFVIAFAVGIVIGCAGLDPTDPNDPNDPNSPGGGCDGSITVYKPITNAVVPVGTDTTLDLATWNLEFFPVQVPGFDCPDPDSPARIEATANLVNALNLDIIAVQEISSPGGFNSLLAACPTYGGAIIPENHGCNFQRTGVLYKKGVVTLNSYRTVFELSDFTREPFEADITATQSGKTYHFKLIVVHLKAGSTADDVSRRQLETAELHAYLNQKATSDPGLDYIVAGDWNDVLTDSPDVSSFPAFVNDPDHYTFVVDPMKARSDMASHDTRLIDLILVNHSACPEMTRARVSTLRFDLFVPGYSSLVSDHRPVMISTPVFK